MRTPGRAVFAMYRSMSHRLPVVNGYAGYVPSSADVIEWGLRRRDPSILTELRRGHPLYVIVAPTEQADQWTAFMDAQTAQFTGIQAGGRVYLMPPAPYAAEVRPGTAVDAATRVDGDWIVADVHQARILRGLELRTHGNLVRLPKDLRIDTSVDGVQWQTVFEERPGGLALLGALDQPRVIPLRVDLGDVDRALRPRQRAGLRPARGHDLRIVIGDRGSGIGDRGSGISGSTRFPSAPRRGSGSRDRARRPA